MQNEKIKNLKGRIIRGFKDNWIISTIGILIGILAGQLFEKSVQLVLPGFTLYIIIILALFSSLIIVIYSQRIKENNKLINNKIENFLLQMDNKFDENIDTVKLEVKKAFINNFRCIFMQDQQERHKTMIECIKNAKKCIYIFSELAPSEVTQKPSHKSYLETLNECIEINKNKKDFNIIRIIVPPLQENNWINELINESPTYIEHFKCLNRYRESSLLEFENGPRGVSILLIDERFLFLKIKPEYEHEFFNHILTGGLFFDDFSSNLVNNFKDCFERNLVANSNPIKNSRLIA